MIDRRPAAIARCANAHDVQAAVRFVTSEGIAVSVKGGGHGVAGKAICEDGLVIDLSLMKQIKVDPDRRIVRAGPGTILRELDHATQSHGLAVPAGTVSETGIAGLTLGGGMGWLARRHGLTCDNLRAVDLVTASGELIRVDEGSDPELMWGLRGGGGNFGIVTEFEYQAHPVGPTVLAGFILYPMARAKEFFEVYADFSAAAPDTLTMIGVMRRLPPVGGVPAELQEVGVAGAGVCFLGNLEDGLRLLEPLRKLGKPIIDTIGPTQFTDHQSINDAGVPWGLNYYDKSVNLPDLTPEMVDTFVSHVSEVPSSFTFVGMFQLGGQVCRIPEDATAYTQRDASHSLAISAGWKDPDDSERQRDWVRAFWKDMEPYSPGGGYINFMSDDDGDERVRAAYGQVKYDRLVALKDRLDPTNLFRLNQNIRPS